MPKPDTGMGGSGYPSEFGTWNPKTKRVDYNTAQWKKQRGSAGPNEEYKDIVKRGRDDSLTRQDRLAKVRGLQDVELFNKQVIDSAQARYLQDQQGRQRLVPSTWEQLNDDLQPPFMKLERIMRRESPNPVRRYGVPQIPSQLSKMIRMNNNKEMRKR